MILIQCGKYAEKKMSATATCEHYIPMLEKYVNDYGHRARLAEKNEGIDWKAICHAFRAAFQVLHIFQDGTFSYPLCQTKYLMDVKAGKLPFKDVSRTLEHTIAEVERLAVSSELPEQPDYYWVNDFLEETLLTHVLHERECYRREDLI